MEFSMSTIVNGEKVTIYCNDGVWRGDKTPFKPFFKNVHDTIAPYFREYAYKSGLIPKLLAELSYSERGTTLELLRTWLQHKEPIYQLFEMISKAVMKYEHKHDAFLRKCSSSPLPEPFESNATSPEEKFEEAYQYAKHSLPRSAEFERNLAALSETDPKAATRILRDWGQGKTAGFQLWEEAADALGQRG
ncbi:hypothetical protein BG53_09100 [Paenibacillus darwinianus]|uniref:Uncharacterized protein n=1 Tax=Paenibacillus darwinianus TaxID=1380763 RepID=A0A9W5RZ50_9BACL|nr:hypothetical protein [Paenibacillus darwinianus]EXX84693.1 hypothetical protein CH50_11120 [Paenibacillus darwinianus]EXX85184.1 hypothetical protein BG52_08960 [Paenibacillus darwinianus]EXX85251.1 hypothetical protein BG53_09100 [Paenibacillus darwinianus]